MESSGKHEHSTTSTETLLSRATTNEAH